MKKIEQILMNEMVVIYRYLMKMGASKEDAEDLVQDTVCKAIEYLDSLDEEKISSWLFKVTINGYYNLYKRKKVSVSLDEQAIFFLRSEDKVVKSVLDREQIEQVQQVLGSLKESYRTLIVMKYFMDLSYKEIGRILDFDESKVKTYLFRARNKFRQVWERSTDERSNRYE